MSKSFILALLAWVAILPLAHSLEIREPVEEIGTFVDLEDGQRLQLFVEEKKVTAHFVDAEGLVMESPAESVTVEIRDSGRRTDGWRIKLTPSQDAALVGARLLPPPYILKSRIIIRFTDGTTKTFPFVFLNLTKDMN
jgi:hypothetical protein